MELQAVIELLLFINDDFQIQDSWGVWLFDSKQNYSLSSIDESLIIYTDSMYVKNWITQRISTRKKRDWRRAKGWKMIANLDQWVTLSKLADQFTSIEWKRTKAHVWNYWNEQVDKRARGEAEKRMK
jgi:ribonuclease HI